MKIKEKTKKFLGYFNNFLGVVLISIKNFFTKLLAL